MPVIPHRPDLFQSCKEIYQFLLSCQQQSIRDNQVKIASLSTAIEAVDPLVVLQHLATPDQPHFYFENPRKSEAIAAIDPAVCHVTDEYQGDRFAQAETFLQTCLDQVILSGDEPLPFSGPHFFNSFTFFNQVSSLESPFPSATVFLPRWQIARCQHQSVLVMNAVVSAGIDITGLAETLWQQWQRLRSLHYQAPLPVAVWPQSAMQQDVSAPRQLKAAVTAALETIQARRLQKIVLAHAIDVTAPRSFSLTQSLQNLRQRYPGCYIFSTSNGKGQTFIGASPERLISIRQGELVTDALAGSAPRGQTSEADWQFANRLRLSEKERHEHRVVVDFITQQLIGIGLQPLSAAVPGLLRLSNIQHLHTPIRAKLPASVHPLQVVTALHPTPAVAGAPRELACEEIRQYETFERSLYAGPLGWVDHQGNSEFIVGIRSALIEENRARLYAGAGIVPGSNPEKELAEIQLKLRALLDALV